MASRSEQLRAALYELRKVPGVEGSAVMSRDGVSVVSDLPPAFDRDTFSAMAAAMLAAAETAMMEIGRDVPREIHVENADSRLVALGVSEELMLMVLAKTGAEPKRLQTAIAAAGASIRGLIP